MMPMELRSRPMPEYGRDATLPPRLLRGNKMPPTTRHPAPATSTHRSRSSVRAGFLRRPLVCVFPHKDGSPYTIRAITQPLGEPPATKSPIVCRIFDFWRSKSLLAENSDAIRAVRKYALACFAQIAVGSLPNDSPLAGLEVECYFLILRRRDPRGEIAPRQERLHRRLP